jgi:WD40-like Beta Propeller Repeat
MKLRNTLLKKYFDLASLTGLSPEIAYRLKPIAYRLKWAKYLLLALCVMGNLPKAQPLRAQTTQTTFGKNRVQYHTKAEEWMYYETEHFTTYWYGDARHIAEAAVLMAEQEYTDVRKVVDYALNDKIELFVFTDLTDLKQSNIGIDELFLIQQGETKVIGSKAFVYFDGNHQHLRKQVREGTAGVVLNAVLFGRNFQEIIQNAVLLNLPDWFPMGVVAYCGEEWSIERDNQLKDILLSGRYKDFKKLARDYPRLAGHAFWYYFSLHYNRNQINSVINILASERAADNSFRYVTNQGEAAMTSGCMTYFMQRYKSDVATQTKQNDTDQVSFKNKKCRELTKISLSPDGQRMAYVLNEDGKWSVYTQQIGEKKRKRHMRRGNRNKLQDPDLHYPLLAWSPDNATLGIVWEYRDEIRLTLLDTKTGKKETQPFTPEYQRIYSLDFVNPQQIALSAAVQGYSDVFLYAPVTRNSERITQDFWDDLDVRVAELDGSRRLLFASNRPTDSLVTAKIDTILPIGHFDLFAYNLTTRSPELQRLTATPLTDERHPVMLDSTHFGYLSNRNGHQNRDAGYLVPYHAFSLRHIFLRTGAQLSGLDTRAPGAWDMQRCLALYPSIDSVLAITDSTLIDSIVPLKVIKYQSVTYHQSNYDRDLLHFVTAPRSGTSMEATRRYCAQKLYQTPIDINQTVAQVPFTRFRQLTSPDWKDEPILAPIRSEKKDTIAQIPESWLFQVPERWQKTTPAIPIVEVESTISKPSDITEVQFIDTQSAAPEAAAPLAINRFNSSRIIPYRLLFRTDYFKTTVDNNLLFEGLESYAGSPQGFNAPTPGILMKGNFKELLENYTLEMGVRVPILFNGAEYYATLDSRRKRIDRRFAVYRKTIVHVVGNSGGINSVPIRMRSNTFLGQYEMRYPFDAFMSLRGTATLRQDKAIMQALDRRSLNEPNISEQRAAVKLALVYDDVAEIDENIRYGTRAKISAEVVQRFALNTQPKLDFEINKGVMAILKLDARHYLRLDRHSIFATRAYAGTSFGAEQVLYYLGGVENWLFPQFQNNIPVAQNRDFSFEAQATNLRGFSQNIRNGNSFALVNGELRVPFAKYLTRKPKLRSFWRNLQAVGFIDAGTAWTGLSPYSGDNPLNTQTFETPPAVSVTVKYFRDPLVMGYGGGMRMKVLGTFLRIDYARGIETRRIQPGRWYLAIGTDF